MFRITKYFWLSCLITLLFQANVFALIPTEDLLDFSLNELMNVEITTASAMSEKLGDAPGNIFVITREELNDRAYGNLTELFKDLPGMDYICVNGDISFKNYWRGYRNSFGADYLLLLDGLPWTDLYYNDAEVLRAFPISNIESIEIVYGPVSSIYGSNAFNGVINIKTINDKKDDGSYYRGKVSGGSHDNASGDLNFFHKHGFTRLSISARFENGDDFPDNNDEYEWSKSTYINNRNLWGGFIDSPASGGLKSLKRHKAIDIRAFYKDMEIGAQYYNLTSGYGIQYAADKVLPNVIWSKTDYSIYGRFKKNYLDVNSTTLIRYNVSNIPNEAALAEGFNLVGYDNFGNEYIQRVVNYELWQSLNSSISASQEFDYIPKEKVTIKTGIQYEQKNLQKAYEISSGPFMDPDDVFADTYPFPDAPSATYKYQNRIITSDIGVFSNVKFDISPRNIINAGVRYDKNSEYGDEITVRTGYIHKMGNHVFKLLYGEAFQEPSPRVLYGAWTGLGSDPALKPEKGQTFEFSVSHNSAQIAHNVSIYFIRNTDTILNLAQGGRNVGERNIYGFDYYLRYNPQTNILKNMELWGYYSYIHTNGDEVYNETTNSYDEGEVGDIAPHKISFGIKYSATQKISTLLTGRYISERKTVATNPINSVPSYFLMDMNIRYKDVFMKGISLSFKANNLFDKHYFHPGIRTADAGNEPGYFDNEGIWHGSAGWLNSLLPQFGRTVFLSLEYDF